MGFFPDEVMVGLTRKGSEGREGGGRVAEGESRGGWIKVKEEEPCKVRSHDVRCGGGWDRMGAG